MDSPSSSKAQNFIASSGNASNKGQRSVFVGNIPYNTTEEELRKKFEVIGSVVSIRIAFDRQLRKPKGYAFCEFLNSELAKSAIRNLNDTDFHGRTLKVAHAGAAVNFLSSGGNGGSFKDLSGLDKDSKANPSGGPRPSGKSGDSAEFPPYDYHNYHSSQHRPEPQVSGSPLLAPYYQQPNAHSNYHAAPPSHGYFDYAPPPSVAPSYHHPHHPGYMAQPPPLMHDYAQPPPLSSSHLMYHPPPHYPPSQPLYSNPYPYGHRQQGPPSLGPPAPQQPVPLSGFGQSKERPNPNLPFHDATPSTESIANALESLPQTQLHTILTQTKALVQNNPSKARQLFKSNPHLTYAVFHSLWRLDLIEPNIIQRIINQSSGSSAPPSQVSKQPESVDLAEPSRGSKRNFDPRISSSYEQQQQPSQLPKAPEQGAAPLSKSNLKPSILKPANPSPTPGDGPTHGAAQAHGSSPTSPNPTPAQMPDQFPPQTPASSLPDQHRALLLQIMKMTQKQIDALPTEQREKVLLLKSQVASQNLL